MQHFKLIIDPSLPDVIEFCTKLLGDQPSRSVRIAHVSSQGGSTAINDHRRGTEKVKSIEQVMDSEDAGQLWIAGHIMTRICKQGLRDDEYRETLDRMMGKLNLPKDFVLDGFDTGLENVSNNEVEAEDVGVSIDLNNDSPIGKVATKECVTSNAIKTVGEMSSSSIKIADEKVQQSRENDGQLSINRFSRKTLKRSKMQENDKH
ncbi:hypothetical protein PIB30_060511 [Stylosanthes scabra]|uniref:Uncharacterized protein n=1 Tax=Stylosanthes scabra TaxID=79078 RepID=A0ABU6ZJ86_9FABA|nr:hypothetical protein [Stylosanthes scabra]